ncbi:MAG: BrnA antitoxin family protein [Desulfomicrobium sp.]|nr:BrnA antitoxin family protein [Desulfomicrobium sp.]
MREEYNFQNGEKNPYTKPQKATVTIRLDKTTVDYFKSLSKEINMPYQTLINAYLADCATKRKKPTLDWGE